MLIRSNPREVVLQCDGGSGLDSCLVVYYADTSDVAEARLLAEAEGWTLRPDDENREDGGEDERIPVGPEVERQRRLQGNRQRADQEAAEHGAAEAPQPTDDRRDERDEDDADADGR